jgi:hypothetical protein
MAVFDNLGVWLSWTAGELFSFQALISMPNYNAVTVHWLHEAFGAKEPVRTALVHDHNYGEGCSRSPSRSRSWVVLHKDPLKASSATGPVAGASWWDTVG